MLYIDISDLRYYYCFIYATLYFILFIDFYHFFVAIDDCFICSIIISPFDHFDYIFLFDAAITYRHCLHTSQMALTRHATPFTSLLAISFHFAVVISHYRHVIDD